MAFEDYDGGEGLAILLFLGVVEIAVLALIVGFVFWISKLFT